MKLRDRRRLARLMVIQQMSHRRLAEAAGWKAHSYVGRLVRGEITSIGASAAARIAEALHVEVTDLFTPEVSNQNGQSVRPHRSVA